MKVSYLMFAEHVAVLSMCVDRALDSRSEGLGFDSQCWPCVEVSANFVFHTASVQPAVMGTWQCSKLLPDLQYYTSRFDEGSTTLQSRWSPGPATFHCHQTSIQNSLHFSIIHHVFYKFIF